MVHMLLSHTSLALWQAKADWEKLQALKVVTLVKGPDGELECPPERLHPSDIWKS